MPPGFPPMPAMPPFPAQFQQEEEPKKKRERIALQVFVQLAKLSEFTPGAVLDAKVAADHAFLYADAFIKRAAQA